LVTLFLLTSQIFSQSCGEPSPCSDESCCICRQNPNPADGTGYQQYDESCKTGGLHCVDNSGCRLCWKPTVGATNVGDRPVCSRFETVNNDSTSNQDSTVCNNEECCLTRQNPNPSNGVGYLEFDVTCKTGMGTHCIDSTGCRLCYKPTVGGVNLGDRPVCRRFETATCNSFTDITNCTTGNRCSWCSYDNSGLYQGYCYNPEVQSCCGLYQFGCQGRSLICNTTDSCCSPLFGCGYGGSLACCPQGTSCCSLGRHNANCCNSETEFCCSLYTTFSTCCPKNSNCCGTLSASWCCPQGRACSTSQYGCL